MGRSLSRRSPQAKTEAADSAEEGESLSTEYTDSTDAERSPLPQAATGGVIHLSNNPRPAATLLDQTICADGAGTPEYEDDDEYEDDPGRKPAPRRGSGLPGIRNPQSAVRNREAAPES